VRAPHSFALPMVSTGESLAERGKIDLQLTPVDLAEAVAHGVETARVFAVERNQIIDVSLPLDRIVVTGDMTRLVQVVQNLLNNASKFSPNGSRIQIRVGLEGRTAVLRLKDSGRGLPDEALDSIFNLFVQQDHHLNLSDTGLGIGLTLCRSLIELHGGAITAASDGPGKGSTFTVRLPVSAVVEGDRAQTPDLATEERVTGTALRVLVIDDNRDSADSLAMLVGLKGYESRVAYGGGDGS
jgi:signal transduction histidine kinase